MLKFDKLSFFEAIEVKSADNTKSKSLNSLMERWDVKNGIRLFSLFCIETVVTAVTAILANDYAKKVKILDNVSAKMLKL